MATNPVSPQPRAVIIVDGEEEGYRIEDVPARLDGVGCPACGSRRLGHHSSYEKYLYGSEIEILRVRCHGCGTTHAVVDRPLKHGGRIVRIESEGRTRGPTILLPALTG